MHQVNVTPSPICLRLPRTKANVIELSSVFATITRFSVERDKNGNVDGDGKKSPGAIT
jgi:hypothetical protein